MAQKQTFRLYLKFGSLRFPDILHDVTGPQRLKRDSAQFFGRIPFDPNWAKRAKHGPQPVFFDDTSNFANQFFLISCMMLGFHKDSQLTYLDYSEKLVWPRLCQKGSKCPKTDFAGITAERFDIFSLMLRFFTRLFLILFFLYSLLFLYLGRGSTLLLLLYFRLMNREFRGPTKSHNPTKTLPSHPVAKTSNTTRVWDFRQRTLYSLYRQFQNGTSTTNHSYQHYFLFLDIVITCKFSIKSQRTRRRACR